MPDDKEELLKQHLKYKKAESKAKKNRVEVEDKLEAIYGTNFKEKSKTFKEEDLGFTINLKKNSYVKMDQEKWEGIRETIPAEIRPEKIKYELNEKGFKWLKENNPEIYKTVSDCVTVTPGKTTIKVEKITK